MKEIEEQVERVRAANAAADRAYHEADVAFNKARNVLQAAHTALSQERAKLDALVLPGTPPELSVVS